MAREERKENDSQALMDNCSSPLLVLFDEQHSSLLIDYLLIIHSLLLIENVSSLQFELVLTHERLEWDGMG